MLSDEITLLLNSLDEQFRRDQVPIPYRAARAASAVARQLRQAVGGLVLDEVNAWFEARYGNRAKMNVLLGEVPLLLDGDLHFLSMAGRIDRVQGSRWGSPGFTWALDAGEEFLNHLTPEQHAGIRELLEMAWPVFAELNPLFCERVLPEVATADLKIALDELKRLPSPQLGLSRWASLQAAEKSFKEYIFSKGKVAKRIHDLGPLHSTASELGLPDLSQIELPEGNLLDVVQCDPSIRYGSQPVTPGEAVAGYHGSLIVCFSIAAKMRLEAGKHSWLATGGEPASIFIARRASAILGLGFSVQNGLVEPSGQQP